AKRRRLPIERWRGFVLRAHSLEPISELRPWLNFDSEQSDWSNTSDSAPHGRLLPYFTFGLLSRIVAGHEKSRDVMGDGRFDGVRGPGKCFWRRNDLQFGFQGSL